MHKKIIYIAGLTLLIGAAGVLINRQGDDIYNQELVFDNAASNKLIERAKQELSGEEYGLFERYIVTGKYNGTLKEGVAIDDAIKEQRKVEKVAAEKRDADQKNSLSVGENARRAITNGKKMFKDNPCSGGMKEAGLCK